MAKITKKEIRLTVEKAVKEGLSKYTVSNHVKKGDKIVKRFAKKMAKTINKSIKKKETKAVNKKTRKEKKAVEDVV